MKRTIQTKNRKIEDQKEKNNSTSDVIGVDIKSRDYIHDVKQNDEMNMDSRTVEIKLPKFKKLADKSKVHLEKKYRTGILSLSQNHTKPVTDEYEANLEDTKKRKLRKVQFELKKLKEEIAQKNIEVIAITKDLHKYFRGNSALGNSQRKATISPFKRGIENDAKTSKNKKLYQSI